jgi:hypothetical protein
VERRIASRLSNHFMRPASRFDRLQCMRILFNPALVIAIFLGGLIRPINAQTSGVLIGFRAPSAANDSGPRYRTLWIVGSHQSARSVLVTDLLVPRQDGFWRIGVAGICGDYNGESQIDTLWTSRATKRVELRKSCPTVTMGNAEVVCSVRKTEIDFVNGRYIGVSETSGQTEQCEPRGDRFNYSRTVRKWEGDSLAFGDVAAVAGDSAFARAARLAVDSASKEECEHHIGDADSRAEEARAISDWYVARGRGRWIAGVSRSIYGSPCSFSAAIDLRLPASFTGHDNLKPSWRTIERAVPAAVDAMTSPAGDLVIVLTPDSLFAYSSAGNALGARVFAMPFQRERVVMIEWAVSKSAARWAREIARLRH